MLAIINHLIVNRLYLECQYDTLELPGIFRKKDLPQPERARIGYKKAKKDGDHDKLKVYADFKRQLRLPVSNFSDIIKENDLDSIRQKGEKCRNQ
jgi:hypothetical protein